MAKDGMVVAERVKQRKKKKESTLLQFALYKSEVVFLCGGSTLFPHRLSKLP